MPTTTRNERSSAIHVGLPWRGMFPTPGTTASTETRAHAAGMYSAIEKFIAITSTETLHKPVDCVLAGQQHSFKQQTRLRGRAMGHAFGE